MKIFLEEDVRVNFVDKNNVFVGYSLSQNCCENADYFISKQPDGCSELEEDPNIEDYTFDLNFLSI